jgi:outer membrane protein assembly factor BamB
MFWFNQRPLLMGDDLYVLPVDSPALMKIDRRSGKLVWQTLKGQGIRARRTDGGWAYFLGPTPGGELAIVYSFRGIEENWAGPYEGGGVHLIDPVTGKTVWELGDWVRKIDHPFLTRSASEGLGADYAYPSQGWPQMVTARPFLSSDGRLSFMSLFSQGWPHYGWEYNLAVVDLNGRKIESQRRHVSAEFLKQAAWSLEKAPDYLSRLEAIPHKDDRTKHEIGTLKAVMERGTIPSNEHGPFLPFSRVTAERFGTVFEARMGPRAISTVYDKAAVKAGLAGKTDPEALFALSELAIAEGRLTEASALIQKCLGLIPVEDLKFRAALNQQLYPTHKELARSGVLSGRSDVEISNCIGMSRTAGTLADEMETLLALSEAYERKGDWQAAATLARYLVNRYGQYEVKVSSLLRGDVGEVRAACRDIVDRADRFAGGTFYAREINGAASVMQKGMDLYFSALTPLEKDLNVRASELGAARLQALQKKFPDLRKAMETEAEGGLARKPVDERVALLSEYAGTVAAQKLVNGMISATEQAAAAKDLTMEMAAFLRKRGWRLADAARLCGAEIPGQARTRLLAPDRTPPPAALNRVFKDVKVDMEEERSPAWMVLGRRDACAIEPDMLFLGARVKKRVDNKFLLYCFDLKTGALKWKAQERRGETWFDEIRLDGSGDEAGFAEALVHGDTVVVHGRYDVLAFRLDDGKIKWRYRAPFAFEIEHAETSGDILVLASQAATVALYLGTDDPRGEVIWEETEQGMLYTEPYFLGDTLASLRKMPFNLTVRYRSTGKLIGRLELPDLLLNEDNPLVENGREALPVARDGKRLAVSDGRYYILLDAEKLKVLWKRLIDANESGQPPLRIALGGDYMAVVKKDYDAKAIYMLSSLTGEVLWSTDPKAAGSPQPIDSMMIRDGRLYGIKPHVGQGFYFEAMDCKTGKDLFRLNEQTGYGGKPDVTLRPAIYGDAVVAEIRDRQTFELKAFNVDDGRLLHTLRAKSAGDFGEHGRASATVQNGSMALLGKDDLELGLAGRP